MQDTNMITEKRRFVKFYFVEPDIVQEHVDPAKVIGGQIDFLSEESLPNVIFSEYPFSFQ